MDNCKGCELSDLIANTKKKCSNLLYWALGSLCLQSKGGSLNFLFKLWQKSVETPKMGKSDRNADLCTLPYLHYAGFAAFLLTVWTEINNPRAGDPTTCLKLNFASCSISSYLARVTTERSQVRVLWGWLATELQHQQAALEILLSDLINTSLGLTYWFRWLAITHSVSVINNDYSEACLQL